MTAQAKPEALRPPAPERAPLKIELALALLIDADRAGQYLTALDALGAYGDSCWHTTVASCRAKGLEFVQRNHDHQHQGGGNTRFQAYRLAPGHREKAAKILAHYRRARGVQPADPEEGHPHD